MKNAESNILKWRFDVSTFRLIGRDLITDRITALFELVKNCYDANATRVDVVFENVSSLNLFSKITIRDNGYGMGFEDIRDKWMVIGTSNKRDEPHSPEPFRRRCVGEKGIGRFAVDKLGDKVNIITKKNVAVKKLNVEIDWKKYETSLKHLDSEKAEDTQGKIILFTDIENKYKYEDAGSNEHGTTLEISGIREIWTKEDIDRLFKELTKLVSPFYPINPSFDVYISSNEYSSYKEEVIVQIDSMQYASHFAAISIDNEKQIQEELYFDKNEGIIKTRNVPVKSFGLIAMKLYYFDESAKKRFKAKFKDYDIRIDGIKIYRDGLITTPFAEFEAHPDKKRDILGIDKRLWRDIFNRLSTRDIIGVVDITKEGNEKIVDATNRQDFVDTAEYRELKEFIISQIDVFADLRIYEREKKKNIVTNELKKASDDIHNFVKTIEDIGINNPQLEQELTPLKKQAIQVDTAVKKGIIEQEKAEKEFLRKENIYLSLMSLQNYAANMSHAVRTSLGKIKDKAEFFKLHYPNSDLEEYFKLYAVEIFEEMTKLKKVTDYMLNYAGSNIPFEDFNIKELIEKLFTEYKPRFANENISPRIEIRDSFIVNANKQFFADIFQNLIDNSIKALNGMRGKIIKCSGYIENDSFILFFSDNGTGIKKEDREKVFELYYTTTSEDGGAGLGLYIVKTRIEALKGIVKAVDNELLPTGATIKITLPFKK
ncbi:MAG: ATP-binding protein [Spirochaetes bacterium]|nr:ATP-binding protein [Spirochaetota bacterium]